MKKNFLILCLCWAGSLGAEEPPFPTEIKMDSLQHVRRQLAEAREKGWDFAADHNEQLHEKPKSLIEFEFSMAPSSNLPERRNASPLCHPMQKTERMTALFRSDIPEARKGIEMDRLNEMERKFKHSEKK